MSVWCEQATSPAALSDIGRVLSAFANDTVHRLPVDIEPNHFEFEPVISGQLFTGLRRQQLALSLNI
jgi:hypothetical protein